MRHQPLRQLSLDAVIAGCRAESQRQPEAGHCFELFRRALDDRDQAAWIALDQQYHSLLSSWVHGPAAGAYAADEVDQIVGEALERFWRTLSRHPPAVANNFDHVGALLKYLQQCVISTILDRRRQDQRRALLLARLHASTALTAAAPSFEDDVLDRLCHREHVAQVRRWVASAVSDPQEQRILVLSFEQGLTPAEIAERHPAEFASAAIVRRIKERILKRARRVLLAEDLGREDGPAAAADSQR